MKLRTTRNSVRLRLSQTEVREFAAGGVVEETVQFGALGGESLTYRLSHSESAIRPTAAFVSNCLTVTVPSEAAEKWAASDDAGIEATQDTGNGAELLILIEKDFACLTPRDGGDDNDTFPRLVASKTC